LLIAIAIEAIRQTIRIAMATAQERGIRRS
jgi:hypothetical protein